MARDLRAETATLHTRPQRLEQQPGPDALRRRPGRVQTRHPGLAARLRVSRRPVRQQQRLPARDVLAGPAAAIREVLAGRTLIDERLVAGLGLDAKGLFAVEYLLFDTELGVGTPASDGRRPPRYAREMAANVLGYANRILRLLGDGRGYGASFAGAGQASVNQLVAQSMDNLDMVLGKFDRVARAAAAGDPLLAAEGYFSGTSLDIAGALIGGTQQLYLGGRWRPERSGSQRLPAIDAALKALFAECQSRLRDLGKPLEVAVAARSLGLRRGRCLLQSLRHIQQVEMASALEA